MMASHGVRAGDARWLAAVAELPRNARPATEVTGSITVITGEVGWGSRLRRAVDDGSVGIVLADPLTASLDELREADLADRSVPVAIDRPRLRSDVALDATPTGNATIHIEVGASRPDLGAVLRDGIGWGRLLAGGELEIVDATTTPRGVLALLRRVEASDDRGPSTVTVLATRGEISAPWIRATVVGAERVEVVVDRRTSVFRSTEDGVLRLPTRFESTARLTLRRVIDAVESSGHPNDLAHLRHDSRLALDLLSPRPSE